MTSIGERYGPNVGELPGARRVGSGGEEPASRRLLLTVTEAAEQLTISRTEMWRMIRRGYIPVVKIGRLTRIRPEALHAFIDTFEVAS